MLKVETRSFSTVRVRAVDLATINKPEYLQKACVKYGFTNWDAVLAAIGHGSLKESQVVSKLIEEKEKHTRTHVSDADIINNIEDKHVNVTPVGNGHKSTILIISLEVLMFIFQNVVILFLV